MKNVLTVLISVFLSLIAVWAFDKEQKGSKHQSVYDHVMQSQTLRCGYVVRAPLFVVDANTGKFSGIMYDVTNELAARLNLKVDWTEEVTLADFVTGVKNHRYDTVCGGIWLNSNRAREIDFTRPMFFETASAYVRPNENRFADPRALNNPSVHLAAMEGTVSAYLAQQYFPLAAKHMLPENAPYEQTILDVAAGKADAGVFADTGARLYQVHNPQKIKRLDKPGVLGVYAVTYPTARGEDDFKQMLSNTISDMLNQGAINTILDRYPDYNGVIRHVSSPYND